MAKQYRPTSAGRRGMMGYDFSNLSDTRPYKNLVRGFKRDKGRNNQGRITVRHKGSGVKRSYREIDFRQNKTNVKGIVVSIEYDPNRTSRIALIKYADGVKKYILAPDGLKVGDQIVTAERTALNVGNRMKIKFIPQGTEIHNIEMFPGKGGQIVRSAGSSAMIMAQDEGYVQIAMPSSELRRVNGECLASIGKLSNLEHNAVVLGKAGRSRHLGIRPTVRGSAMNPVDHPYGGGEGKQGRGTRKPKTAHGKITGGHKTRNKNKKSNKFIIRRRSK